MEKHQRNNSANGRIMTYMEQEYLYPTDFATLLYASQMLQAEAIKNGVEHLRRHRGRCMGCLLYTSKADFDTYYQELLTKLILGQASMDDWDSYISDMKELGLDELISITQERYDRAQQ